jgi:hypothetical protein
LDRSDLRQLVERFMGVVQLLVHTCEQLEIEQVGVTTAALGST